MILRAKTHRAARLTTAARIRALIGTLAAGLLAAPAAMALEEGKGEAAAISDCDKRLCAILVGKDAEGPDLKCALTKTWARRKIKEADSQHLTWGFGDARCSMEINLSRERLVAAVTRKRATFRMPRHTAQCIVEVDGRPEKVTAVLAPKIKFKNGRAYAVWVRLKSIDGPASITLTAKAAAQLADTFGVFHRQMLRNINRYISRHCPKTLAAAAKPAPDKGKANEP